MNRIWRALILAILWPIARLHYDIRVTGRENLPEDGPFLLISNHVSFADALIVTLAARRSVRFLMWRYFYAKPVIGWVCRVFRAIPIEPSGSIRDIRGSLDSVVDALNEGDPICMFPEGSMTRTGHVQGFRRGFEIIARKAQVPVVPMCLDGLWGSIFTYEGGKSILKWPKTWRRRVTVCFGKPLPPTVSAVEARTRVTELQSHAWALRKRRQRPLHFMWWRIARRMGGKKCMADSTGLTLTWRRALAGSLMVSRWIRRRCPGQTRVGMMMPASCGAALINTAAVMCGRTPVNLNFTGSPDSIRDVMQRCDLKVVFTSRTFLDRIGLDPMEEFIYLEDILRGTSGWRRLVCLLAVVLVPSWIAERTLLHRSSMDDLATIMFTSGSSGKPKGVMLSHHNIVSNVEQMTEVLQFGPTDTIMGVLPPFHTFGFTTTLWLPLTCGVRAVYHPNPLDAKGVGEMVEKHHATIIMGTPSFYSIYTRGCRPEQFRSLRLVISGGQKLLGAVSDAFEERFGLPISEGYGCTELSPVVSVNRDDVEVAGVKQIAFRRGSVGRPLPGLSVRIVHEKTFEPVPDDAAGVVLIKGPIVMMGYMDDPEATDAVLRDGWYVTSDLGTVDDDGFLYIHDRISRFAKIGGEMIPHAAVEEAFQQAVGSEENHFAVLSVSDRVRGERLVVFYDGPPLDHEKTLKQLSASRVPRLWIPAASDIHHVESVPMLPSGKLDLATLRRMAAERQGDRKPR